MFEAFRTIGSWGVIVFVVTSMLNVGLTQKPSRLLEHLSNRAFLVRMLVINLVVVPALMIAPPASSRWSRCTPRACCCEQRRRLLGPDPRRRRPTPPPT